jgi:putative endopeptidase
MPVKRLQALAPAMDWVAFFGEAGVKPLASPTASVDVSMPAFMGRLSALIESTPIEDWRVYLRYHTVRGAMPWLGQTAYDEAFSFTSKLTGQKTPSPRWKRAANIMDGAMGEALGKAYVETEFPPSSKARMVELVNNLRAALKERIETRPWMGAATRKQALVKLDAILQKIGYPDKWLDYTSLKIESQEPAFAGLRRAQQFEQKRQLAKIGKRVDRNEWQMTAATVNAYYNPPTNEICFPAGILQPPMFDPQADDAANYGAIGAVIGHELTHGFDDEGRKYDAAGNLKDWWTAEDGKEFEARTQRLVDQYSSYIVEDTLHANGKFTLGENLGDLGGVIVAHEAWKLSLKGKPAPESIGGFTPEQRFFLSFAQIWRNVYRPELTRLVSLTDPHSLPHWRVVGPLGNIPEFAQAFHCQSGDPMVIAPEKRTEVW